MKSGKKVIWGLVVTCVIAAFVVVGMRLFSGPPAEGLWRVIEDSDERKDADVNVVSFFDFDTKPIMERMFISSETGTNSIAIEDRVFPYNVTIVNRDTMLLKGKSDQKSVKKLARSSQAEIQMAEYGMRWLTAPGDVNSPASRAYGVWLVVESASQLLSRVNVLAKEATFFDIAENAITVHTITDTYKQRTVEEGTTKIEWISRDGKFILKNENGTERFLSFADDDTMFIEGMDTELHAKSETKLARSSPAERQAAIGTER